MSNWEKIAEARPIDSTARNVTSRGIHFSFRTPDFHVRSDIPLPTRDEPKMLDEHRCLIGKQFGRLTLIGLSDDIRKNGKNARWVVRCTCGFYEHRTLKFLTRETLDERRMCSHCDHLEERKKGLGPWSKGPQGAA